MKKTENLSKAVDNPFVHEYNRSVNTLTEGCIDAFK